MTGKPIEAFGRDASRLDGEATKAAVCEADAPNTSPMDKTVEVSQAARELREPKGLAERRRAYRGPGPRKDAFQTQGDLRAAAFLMCEALRGTPLEQLASEIHDSIGCAIRGDSETEIPGYDATAATTRATPSTDAVREAVGRARTWNGSWATPLTAGRHQRSDDSYFSVWTDDDETWLWQNESYCRNGDIEPSGVIMGPYACAADAARAAWPDLSALQSTTRATQPEAALREALDIIAAGEVDVSDTAIIVGKGARTVLAQCRAALEDHRHG